MQSWDEDREVQRTGNRTVRHTKRSTRGNEGRWDAGGEDNQGADVTGRGKGV